MFCTSFPVHKEWVEGKYAPWMHIDAGVVVHNFHVHKIPPLQIGPIRCSIFDLRVCLEFSQPPWLCKSHASNFSLQHETCNLEFVYSCCAINLVLHLIFWKYSFQIVFAHAWSKLFSFYSSFSFTGLLTSGIKVTHTNMYLPIMWQDVTQLMVE